VANANEIPIDQKAVLVVRPERITLVSPEMAQIRGIVPETIYSGSDLMAHARLADGTPLRVRMNGNADSHSFTGKTAGFSIPSDAFVAFAE
jgi:ABC-type Fe3+/spermidine/putrescine transport system ATPase subunit